jgi:haloacetate dehalogenase
MRRLGYDRFHAAGHDRGSYAALRLALDHPEAVDRLVLMDCLPIIEHLERADARFATAWWHWFFFAQPDIPERVIGQDPHAWYAPKARRELMGDENHDELMAAVSDPATVRAMLEDYRAGLTIDAAHDAADRAAGRRVERPVLVLWSSRDDLEELYGDPLAIWRTWADDVRGRPIDSGHHMAEEAPDALVRALVDFLGQPA